jgi:hypothetical protein
MSRFEEALGLEPHRNLPQASDGRKEYKDDKGQVTNEITDIKAGDGETLPASAPRREGTLGKVRLSAIAVGLFEVEAAAGSGHGLRGRVRRPERAASGSRCAPRSRDGPRRTRGAETS